MVGIVIVSHSDKIADGVKELALQMAPDVCIETAGGTSDGRIGTDVEKIIGAINKVYSEDGVLILFDLGSALMNAEMAMECIDMDKQEKIKIVDCALVEGGVVAAVEAGIGNPLEEIQQTLKTIKFE